MWKFQDFSITQILREINFEDSRMAKTAIFAILRAVNFVQMVNFSLKKSTKIHKNQNSESLNVVKMADFVLQKSSKLISRKI